MPFSETSFADRYARGQLLQSHIAGFTPVFSPADSNLGADAFQSYLNGVEAANDAVSDAETTLKPLTDERVAAADALKDKALRLKDHISANVNWKKFLPGIVAAADAVRGYRPAKKKPDPAATTTPPKAKQGARSQQGFADLEKLFGKLVGLVKKVTGYTAAANSGLTVAELEAQDEAFIELNNSTVDAEANYAQAVRERKEYYDGEGGLKEKMKAIKKAVRSQYGTTSTEYAAVKGIEL